jgi:hypothetical protein
MEESKLLHDANDRGDLESHLFESRNIPSALQRTTDIPKREPTWKHKGRAPIESSFTSHPSFPHHLTSEAEAIGVTQASSETYHHHQHSNQISLHGK